MSSSTSSHRYDYYALLAFAFTAVASIALQNLIWISIILFFFFKWKEHRKIDWPDNLFTMATLVFLMTFFIGAIVGVNPAKSFQTVHKYLTFLVLFPVGAMALSLMDIRKLLYFFIAGASVCAVWGIIYKHFILHQDRIDSFSGDKMVFGGMLMVSFILNITLIKQRPTNYWLWASSILVLTALIFTETRGSWIGTLAGIVLLFWRWNKKLIFLVLITFIACFFLLPTTIQTRVKSIGDFYITRGHQGEIIEASPARLMIWIAGLNMIKDHPMGVGQGNVEDIYPKYRLANPYNEPTVPHLHDNFLQIWAQNGWLGLAAYLFWIFAFYFKALIFKATDPDVDQWNWMFLCIFSAILVWGLTEYTFSHQFMNVQFFLYGLAVSLWTQYTKSKTT